MSARLSDPIAAAGELLAANTRSGERDGRCYRFSVPAPGHYPFQWLWDCAFHTIAWTLVDRERAKEELRGLYAHQRPNGMIPHIVFWDPGEVSLARFYPYSESTLALSSFLRGRRPRTSEQTQPPVLAQAVEAIVDGDPDPGPYLRETLPILARLYRFWAAERDPDGDGLVAVISQFETGLDYSPAYDAAISADPERAASIFVHSRAVQLRNRSRGYEDARLARSSDLIEDVLVNVLYADGLAALARLARRGGDDAFARWAERQAQVTTDALLDRCWDPRRGLFFGLHGPHERPLDRVATIQGLTPLLLPGLPAEVRARLLDTLTDPRRFWPAYPVPSVALDEPAFLATSRLHGIRLIWRGPLSMNTNWILHRSLVRHGERELARTLAGRSLDLIERFGFNEFYSPLDGTPVGEDRFGWATLGATFAA